MEERYKEIAESLDNMPENEKAFISWYLLKDFINECEGIINKEPRNLEEYKEYVLCKRLASVGSEIRDIMYYGTF